MPVFVFYDVSVFAVVPVKNFFFVEGDTRCFVYGDKALFRIDQTVSKLFVEKIRLVGCG